MRPASLQDTHTRTHTHTHTPHMVTQVYSEKSPLKEDETSKPAGHTHTHTHTHALTHTYTHTSHGNTGILREVSPEGR